MMKLILILFGLKKYDAIYNRIRCCIGVKSGITYKYYLQVYLNNCTYKTVNTEMVHYLDENLFETD